MDGVCSICASGTSKLKLVERGDKTFKLCPDCRGDDDG